MLYLAITLILWSVVAYDARSAECSGSASYKLDVNYMWVQSRFGNVPSSAHFSPLVAFSHKNRFSAFAPYGYATTGIKNVAEVGTTTVIRRELRRARNRKFVLDSKIDPRIPGGGGSVSVVVKVSCAYPFITAFSMIAPSPDWFVALYRINVVKKGTFVKSASGRLVSYDAGTDSGSSFLAPDQPTSPRENIAPIYGSPFSGRALARYKLTKM